MDRKFEDILNECIDRMHTGGESIEQCLERYPGEAGKLEPLLRLVLGVARTTAVEPRSEFKAACKARLYAEIAAVRERRLRSKFLFLGWHRRWVTAIAVVLAILMAGGGAAAASGGSMPDETLYPVKLATEQMQLGLAFSDMGKAQLHARLADRRVSEIAGMVEKDEPAEVDMLTQRLNDHLQKVEYLARMHEIRVTRQGQAAMVPEDIAELKALVEQYASNNREYLQKLEKGAPQKTRPALRRAIVASEEGYSRCLRAFREK